MAGRALMAAGVLVLVALLLYGLAAAGVGQDGTDGTVPVHTHGE